MSRQSKPPVVIKKNEDAPEPDVIIAKAIIDLSDAAHRMDRGPLKRRTIVLLLRDMTGVAMADIEKILSALPRLRDEYTR